MLRAAAAHAAGAAEGPALDRHDCDAGRVLDLAADELLSLLDAVLAGPAATRGLELLEASGVLGVLLPEAQALVGFHESCRVHHKDLWAHTLEVLERTPPDPDLRWVALLHDVGKTSTRVAPGGGQVSFLRHERVGAWLARGVGARLAFPAARLERICFVLQHHARVNAYEAVWSDRAVRRMVRDAGPRLADLVAFAGADYTTRRPRRRAQIQSRLREFERRVAALAVREAAPQALPSGLGHAICEALGLTPGPVIGEHLRWLRAQVASGALPGGAAVEVYVAALRAGGRAGGQNG